MYARKTSGWSISIRATSVFRTKAIACAYRYLSPAFNTDVELVYDQSGLAVDYPGIAVRAF